MENFAIISAFSDIDHGLLGNNAAIVYSDKVLPYNQRQAIAVELQQPATTFLNPIKNGHFEVSWFAPDAEIDLCGHGSLAAAAYLNNFHQINKATLHYEGGHLKIGYDQGSHFLWIDPIEVIDHCKAPLGLAEGLGLEIHDYFTTSNKHIVVVKSEDVLAAMKPDFQSLANLEPFGYAVTAPGKEVDFVSRTLVPKVQQLEDHATGSSHAVLAPFWAERLLKDQMSSLQLSPRGGAFQSEIHLNKVLLKGQTRLIASGHYLI